MSAAHSTTTGLRSRSDRHSERQTPESTAIPQGRSQSGHCSKAKCRPERQKAVPRSARPRRRARQNAARADETRARTRVIRSWLDARGNASRRTGRTAQTSARSSPILGRRPAALLPLPHTPPRRESGTAREHWHCRLAPTSCRCIAPTDETRISGGGLDDSSQGSAASWRSRTSSMTEI